MRVALYTEGPADLAVITNILKGVLDIDKSDIKYDLPDLEFDETDLQNQKEKKFSNWTLVKKECEEREKISMFLESFDAKRFVVIHIDTAERNEKGFEATNTKKEKTNAEYSIELRNEVILKLNGWLKNNYSEKIAYGIAIEETDAWVLTIANTVKGDTAFKNDPKKYLKENWHLIVSKSAVKQLRNYSSFNCYSKLSEAFRKEKTLKPCRLKNKSLDDFCNDLLKFR